MLWDGLEACVFEVFVEGEDLGDAVFFHGFGRLGRVFVISVVVGYEGGRV